MMTVEELRIGGMWCQIVKKASNYLEAGKAGVEIYGMLIIFIEPSFEF